MALAAAVLACAVWASPAAAETVLAVDAGYAGAFVAGNEVPVRIRVSADRLVRGTLEVGIGNPGNATPVAMPVEVPGGGQKEFVVTAPSGLDPSPDVVVRLLQGEEVVASAQTRVRATNDTELVGILPGALDGRPVPGPAPLAVDAGTATFAALGGADLEQAPASLGPLSTVIAGATEIGALSPGARAGVLRWIEAGGRLLVDVAKGQAVPGLPDAWQPGAGGRTAAGLGEVIAAEGAVADGRWAGLVEPSGWAARSGRSMVRLPLASTLAADAGLRSPEIAWLVGFLVVYVALVGPVAFFVLRRRGRPELAWVAVPLAAVVFSAGSWAVGHNLRNATELVHASVVSAGAGGPVATTYVGVFSRSGGTERIGFPAGWSGGGFADLGAAGPTQLALTAAGPQARLPLDTGQFGMVSATGPVAGEEFGGLEVRVGGESDGRVSGEVRNRMPYRLDQVAVFVGTGGVGVGNLQPGEMRPFTVDTTLDLARLEGNGGAELRVWSGFVGNPADRVSDFGLWQAMLQSAGPNFRSPSAVVAAGWTRDHVPALRAGGGTAEPEGRTLVVGRAEVPLPTQGTTAVAARREIVRDPFSNRFAGPIRGGGTVVRFTLPAGADTSNLVLTNLFGSAEVWHEGRWQPAACTGPGCPPAGPVPNCPPGVPCAVGPPGFRPVGPGAQLVIPAASVAGGVVHVRVPGPAATDQPAPLSIGRSA